MTEKRYHMAEFTSVEQGEDWLNAEYEAGYVLRVGPVQGVGSFFLLLTERADQPEPEKPQQPTTRRKRSGQSNQG